VGGSAALARATDAAAQLALALPAARPSPGVWQSIEAAIGPRTRARSSEWIAGSLAAAAVLLLVWVVVDRGRMQGEIVAGAERAKQEGSARARCADELARSQADAKLQQQALELLQRPGARLIALAPQPGVAETRANIILHTGDQRAFLVGGGLAAPSGKDYELWLIRGDQKIPAGLLRGDAKGALLTAIDPALLAGPAPDAIAVTLEPAGGGPAPRGPIVLVGKI